MNRKKLIADKMKYEFSDRGTNNDADLKTAADGVDIEKDQISLKDPEPDEPAEEKTGTKKSQKEKPVSVYLAAEDKKKLKALSATIDLSVSEIIRMAVRKYVDEYQLSETDRKIFTAKLNQDS